MKFLYLLPIALILSCGAENQEASDTSDSEITEEVLETENELEISTQIVEDLDNDAFKAKLNTTKGILIDVRTAEEYNEGHIEGAVNMDFYADDFSSQLDSLNKDVVVYVYCRSGGRSGKTRDQLAEKGFSQVYNLASGFSQWDK